MSFAVFFCSFCPPKRNARLILSVLNAADETLRLSCSRPAVPAVFPTLHATRSNRKGFIKNKCAQRVLALLLVVDFIYGKDIAIQKGMFSKIVITSSHIPWGYRLPHNHGLPNFIHLTNASGICSYFIPAPIG